MKALLAAAAFSIALASSAQAQTQVTPADSAAVLLELATKLRAEGRIALASSLLDVILERWGNTPSAAGARSLRLEMRPQQDEQSGKTEMVVWSTTYGAALGVLWPAAFEAEDAGIYGLGLLAGAPIGFLIGREAAAKRNITEGQARAFSLGSLWGGLQTAGWLLVFDFGAESRACGPFGDETCTTGEDGSTILALSLIGSGIGTAVGAYLASKPIAAGTAAAASTGALWGIWYGVVAHRLTGDDNVEDEDLGWALGMVGGNAGLVMAARTARKFGLSDNRVRLIHITGIAGLVSGVGILLIADTDDYGDSSILVPAATSVLGLALGTYWTRHYDDRATGPRRSDSGGALLEWNTGWRFDTPRPFIRALESRRDGRPVNEAGIYVPLFKARFN